MIDFKEKTRDEKILFLCEQRIIPSVEISSTDWDGTIDYTSVVSIPLKGQVLDLVGDYFDIEDYLQKKHKDYELHLNKIDTFVRLRENKTYLKALDKSIEMAYYLYKNKILLFHNQK